MSTPEQLVSSNVTEQGTGKSTLFCAVADFVKVTTARRNLCRQQEAALREHISALEAEKASGVARVAQLEGKLKRASELRDVLGKPTKQQAEEMRENSKFVSAYGGVEDFKKALGPSPKSPVAKVDKAYVAWLNNLGYEPNGIVCVSWVTQFGDVVSFGRVLGLPSPHYPGAVHVQLATTVKGWADGAAFYPGEQEVTVVNKDNVNRLMAAHLAMENVGKMAAFVGMPSAGVPAYRTVLKDAAVRLIPSKIVAYADAALAEATPPPSTRAQRVSYYGQ
jgi:hypothetical protein